MVLGSNDLVSPNPVNTVEVGGLATVTLVRNPSGESPGPGRTAETGTPEPTLPKISTRARSIRPGRATLSALMRNASASGAAGGV